MQIVAYFRQSTEKQAESGLGLEAQRRAVREYVARTGAEVIGRYTETESGTRSDRPQLARALAHARRSRAKLVVATLSRLSRNLAFLDALQRSKVNFCALDCEHANKAMLQMMTVMAEWEADQVSERTRKAMASRRELGKPMGAENPRCRNLTADAAKEGRKLGAAANAQLADEAYSDILPDMLAWRERGDTLATIAERLNSEGQTTRTGVAWSTSTVANVLRRGAVLD